LQPKRVRNAADATGIVHEQDVEADAGRAPIRVGGKRDLGGGQQAGALAGAEGAGGGAQVRAGLHLDEGEQAVAFGDEVEFAGFGAQAPGQDGPAVPFERGAGGGLGGHPAGLGDPAADDPGAHTWNAVRRSLWPDRTNCSSGSTWAFRTSE